MTFINSIDCVALYGSRPRGDFDEKSDRDVLVVANNQADRIDTALTSAGFSPTVYSWQQLNGLARDGSLFIQHLKQESRVILDPTGELNKLLLRFKPKKEYGSRLLENRRLFEITNGVPAIAPAVSWAFDVLAVAFRNHAILHIANRETYIFSYAALVREIAFEFGLRSAEIELLHELRTKKREYRFHPHTEPVSLGTLRRAQGLLEKLFHADCTSLQLSPRDFVTKLLAPPHDDAHWYLLLRSYEGAYRTMGFVPTHDAPASLCKIEHVFGKPSPYGTSGSNSIIWVQNQVRRLASRDSNYFGA